MDETITITVSGADLLSNDSGSLQKLIVEIGRAAPKYQNVIILRRWNC